VWLLSPHDVRPYVRRNKTDRTDARGLLEANRNDEIHPVPVKTIEYQTILAASSAFHVARHSDGAAEHPPWSAGFVTAS
jgi:hypothetical protein